MVGSRMRALLATAALAAIAGTAHAADFDWKRHKGETVAFLANNNPLAQALLGYKSDFEALTGITLKTDMYQEQQMRQRLVTVMNARSDEVDVFMTLPSREGQQFAGAGWYADLGAMTKNDVAPDYHFDGISPALVKAATIGSKLTSVPLNIEGPVLYYRIDLFQKCGVAVPQKLDEIETAAKKLKACDSSVVPFVSRGLKPAVAYTFSNFMHNSGGAYIKNGKSSLCAAPDKKALDLYGTLLKDYGPPGVVNYSFYQISSLYREGRAAMAFESSNELRTIMDGGARLKDTAIMALPPGDAGSVPTAIGWGLSISSYSGHKDAAWYFLQWASSPEIQKRLALQGIAAPRSDVAKTPEFQQWLKAEPVRQFWQSAIDTLAEKGSSEVGYPIVANPESREFIGQAVIDLLLGKANVDKACADADKSLDALIAQD